MERGLLSTFVREDIKKGEYLRALLEASADLEHLFFMKLLFEKCIKSNLMEGWTLGKYIDWVSKMGLLDKKYEQLLKDFNKIRNYVVHERYVMKNINSDLAKLSFLANLIISVCDFIDSYEVQYTYNREIENEYSNFMEKMTKRYENIFSK